MFKFGICKDVCVLAYVAWENKEGCIRLSYAILCDRAMKLVQ